jgi:hypothetical protein
MDLSQDAIRSPLLQTDMADFSQLQRFPDGA